MTAVSWWTKKAMEIIFTPWLSGGDYLAVFLLWQDLSPQHLGDVGAPDVGVQQAHLRAGLGEGESQRHGDGGLADAALAAAHGDDVRHARDGGLLG